jgi:putative mRNA 3-end processing factor
LSNEVTKQYIPFQHLELEKMMDNIKRVELNQEFEIGNIKIKLINAGHIPGSASIIIEGEGKRIAYTGDINSQDSSLVQGADTNYGELDLLITESTYGLNDHPERKDVENEFVSFAKEITDKGGTLLVPAFAVGRSQEIACTLNDHNFSKPVAMDGMALKTNQILKNNLECLKDSNAFLKTLDELTVVKNWKQRKELLNTPSVIIAPAGMMVGGLSSFYKDGIIMDKKNAISLVSFQVEGTPGRMLLDKKMIRINNKLKKIKGKFEHFNFSSHSGNKELFEMISGIKGEPTIVAVHGEEEQSLGFANAVKEKYGYEAIAPKLGDKIKI